MRTSHPTSQPYSFGSNSPCAIKSLVCFPSAHRSKLWLKNTLRNMPTEDAKAALENQQKLRDNAARLVEMYENSQRDAQSASTMHTAESGQASSTSQKVPEQSDGPAGSAASTSSSRVPVESATSGIDPATRAQVESLARVKRMYQLLKSESGSGKTGQPSSSGEDSKSDGA
jgi:hypothetical protein